MNETQQAELLAAWLAQGGGPVPEGLDADVVEAMLVLRPELAPPPALTLDQVLADVSTGPFAPRASALGSEEAATVPAPANRRAWWVGLGGLVAAALVAIAVLPEPMSPADPAAKRDAALAEPVVAASSPAPAPPNEPVDLDARKDEAAAPEAERKARAEAPELVGGLGLKGSGEGGGGAGYGSIGAATTRAPPVEEDADRNEETVAPAKALQAQTPTAPEPDASVGQEAAGAPPSPPASPSGGLIGVRAGSASGRAAAPALAKKESAKPQREAAAADLEAADEAERASDDLVTLSDAPAAYADVRAEAGRLAASQPLAAARMLEPWVIAPINQGQRAALDAATWALKAGDRVYAAQLVRAGLALSADPTPARDALLALLNDAERAP